MQLLERELRLAADYHLMLSSCRFWAFFYVQHRHDIREFRWHVMIGRL
jgi:hypothetical protein